MSINKKKVLFSIADIIILLVALWWVMWLCFYYSATVDGPILINSAYNLFERNYLVPLQIFGITVLFTVLTAIFYPKLRKKNIIGREYIALALFQTVPFWVLSVIQVWQMITLWDMIY